MKKIETKSNKFGRPASEDLLDVSTSLSLAKIFQYLRSHTKVWVDLDSGRVCWSAAVPRTLVTLGEALRTGWSDVFGKNFYHFWESKTAYAAADAVRERVPQHKCIYALSHTYKTMRYRDVYILCVFIFIFIFFSLRFKAFMQFHSQRMTSLTNLSKAIFGSNRRALEKLLGLAPFEALFWKKDRRRREKNRLILNNYILSIFDHINTKFS